MNLNSSSYRLSFEWDSDNEVLEIHADDAGLRKLKTAIETLLKKPNNDHAHFMTKDWGGDELSNDKLCAENTLINHVKLFKWENE